MKLGYMTNAFGPLVGAGGGVTNVKDVRYVTMADDEKSIEVIASKGYRFIEIFDGNLSAYEADTDRFKKIMEKHKVELLGVYIGAGFIYEDAREDELFRINKVSALAAKLGARHIVLGGGAVRGGGIRDTDYPLLAAGLDQAKKIVENYGLIASYHPHLGSMAQSPEQIDKIFALTDISFCPDIAHLAAGGGDALELVEKYYDRIRYVHLKDWNKSEFVPLGQGVIDLKGIIEFLKDKNYGGDWLVEIDGYSGSAEEACGVSYDFVKKFFPD